MDESKRKYDGCNGLFEMWAIQPTMPAKLEHWQQILAAGTLLHDRRREEINTVAILRTAIELFEVRDIYWAFTAYALADISIDRKDKFGMIRLTEMEPSNAKGYANGKTMGSTEG